MPVRRHARVPLALLLVIGCGGEAASGPPPAGQPSTISPEAHAYLTAVLDIMQAHSVRRKEIEWPPFRTATFELAGAAQATAETYEAIVDAIGRLADRHSFFVPPSGARTSRARAGIRTTPSRMTPTGRVLSARVGYISMPPFSSFGEPFASTLEHAQAYHDLIRTIDSGAVCAWIVDLRGNSGGNMWPMLAGIGPVLGEGITGFFVDPDSVTNAWFYRDGAAGLDDGPPSAWAASEYELRSPDPPAAAITDVLTASAGEAVAVAFRGRPDTRSFGASTSGLTTANRGFALSDGPTMFLAVSTFVDRTGRVYGDVVTPDELVFGPSTGDPSTDPALAAALLWAEGQPACTS